MSKSFEYPLGQGAEARKRQLYVGLEYIDETRAHYHNAVLVFDSQAAAQAWMHQYPERRQYLPSSTFAVTPVIQGDPDDE